MGLNRLKNAHSITIFCRYVMTNFDFLLKNCCNRSHRQANQSVKQKPLACVSGQHSRFVKKCVIRNTPLPKNLHVIRSFFHAICQKAHTCSYRRCQIGRTCCHGFVAVMQFFNVHLCQNLRTAVILRWQATDMLV